MDMLRYQFIFRRFFVGISDLLKIISFDDDFKVETWEQFTNEQLQRNIPIYLINFVIYPINKCT